MIAADLGSPQTLKPSSDTLDQQNVTLIGIFMGGREVARYMSLHGGACVSKVALISPVTRFMLKPGNNPVGVDKSVFNEMLTHLKKTR
jgi:pimeloyl-ACP methyl ester carboxylesterase